MAPQSSHLLLSLPLLLGALQGLFLSFTLPRIHKAHPRAVQTLSALLLVGSVSLILYVCTIVYPIFPLRSIVFLDSLAFMFAPLTYRYFSKLLFPTRKLGIPPAGLFGPAMLHFFYGVFLFGYSEQNMAIMVQAKMFELEWLFIFIVLIGWTLTLSAMSAHLLIRFRKNARNLVSFKPQIRYLSLFLVALLLGTAICSLFALDFFFEIRFFPFTKTYIGWTIIPFVIYAVTYVSMGRPELLRVPYQIPRKAKSKRPSEELEALKISLESAMVNDQLYRNPTLSLQELAEKLKVGQTKLSHTINQCYHCNFYEFVNRFRLQDFIAKVEQNAHKKHTLLAIAFDVGFNSKTTFNKSFKQLFHLTPSQYINQLGR